jgi:hypothetical protein
MTIDMKRARELYRAVLHLDGHSEQSALAELAAALANARKEGIHMGAAEVGKYIKYEDMTSDECADEAVRVLLDAGGDGE